MTRKPGEAPEKTEGGEPLLTRWSRLKKEARQSPPPAEKPADPESPAPQLPPIDKLTLESDYRAFFHPKVGDDVRRAALKKLFSDPHFNVMDGLDTYIDDYSKTEPIPAAMMAGLRQAQNILQWAKEDEEKRAQDAQQKQTAPRRLESTAPQPSPQPDARGHAPEMKPGSSGDVNGQSNS